METIDLKLSHHSSIIPPSSIHRSEPDLYDTASQTNSKPRSSQRDDVENLRSQTISSFLHHPSIHQSQICMVHPHNMAPHLGPANEMMLRTFDFKLSHHSSIIYPSIRARFVWCSLTRIALGLGTNQRDDFLIFWFFFCWWTVFL